MTSHDAGPQAPGLTCPAGKGWNVVSRATDTNISE